MILRYLLCHVLMWSTLACNTENPKPKATSESPNSGSKYYSELPFNKDLLEEGDIILRRGSGILSRYIINQLKDSLPVSHCGIIIKNEDQIHVIHSILSEQKGIKGVTKEPLDVFIKDALLNSLVIVRQKQPSQYKLDFVNKAEKILTEKIPFDPLFDIQTEEKMYCTEIIWHISKELLKEDIFKEKIKAGNIELLQFNNFFNPTYFEVVYSDFE